MILLEFHWSLCKAHQDRVDRTVDNTQQNRRDDYANEEREANMARYNISSS
jgi:hypothetical protein